jgi:hypothetical protein
MIEEFYAVQIKNSLNAAAINVVHSKDWLDEKY